MLLKWYNQKCSHVPYLLKCDDDVFLNTKNLHNLVSKINMDDVLTGYLLCDNKPVRDTRYKTYIPESVYSEDTFPPQLMGGGYLISSSAAQKLFRAARHVPWFVYEDVYLTGMVARAAGITPNDHSDFNQYYSPFTRRWDSFTSRSILTSIFNQFFQTDPCIYIQIILVMYNLRKKDIIRITKVVGENVESRNRDLVQKRPQVHCRKS